MSAESFNKKRLAKNTIYMYIRMMIVMIVSLYMVRIVLNSLGVEDYGIFNVVAGVITLLQSISITLSTSTQRYFSYYIGLDDSSKLKEVFSTSLKLYFLFCVFVIVLGETIGLWFINTQLVIPAERMVAANVVYQFSLLSFVVTMLTATFSSAVISHEDMGLYAIVSLSECFLKLVFALLIQTQPFDKLYFYSGTLFLVSIISFSIYGVYALRRYPECRKYIRTNSMTKEMIHFTGWTIFASLASVCMYQVNTILINIFFGPIVNAARAISMQVNNAINSFSSSFMTTVKPPIIKSYADGNYDQLNKIFSISNKLILYLLGFFAIPLFIEMRAILRWWLCTDDPQTVLFSQLMLVYAVILALNNPISFIIQATGRIKEYNVTVEIFTILCMPSTYLAFKLGAPAVTTFILMIVAVVLSHIARLVNLKKYYSCFSCRDYIVKFLFPALLILALEFVISWGVHCIIHGSFLLKFVIMLLLGGIVVFPLTYVLGLNTSERNLINKFLKKII